MDIECLKGINFSGRSNYLKNKIQQASDYGAVNPYGIYIGEIPANYLSGLAPTVRDEILLHTTNKESKLFSEVNALLEGIAFFKHFDKNPFSLSGGEQAILSIISALLMHPQKVAIDITIEQLNKAWRTPLFEAINKMGSTDLSLAICDNRLNEYENNNLHFILNDNYQLQREISENIFKNISIKGEGVNMIPAKNLAINRINFTYRGSNVKVLDNCTYEFHPGIIYNLKGENGSGKSTLSKLLCGVLKANSGKIFIGNSECNTYKYPGKQIGYSFQNPDEQLFSVSVRKELGLDGKVINKKNIDFLIESFGLTNLLERHPAELPFVIRKRLAIVGTFINERDWYILDEPTIGQDNTNMNEIANLVKLLAGNGKGIILISHSDSFIQCFEKVNTVTLKNGKLEA